MGLRPLQPRDASELHPSQESPTAPISSFDLAYRRAFFEHQRASEGKKCDEQGGEVPTKLETHPGDMDMHLSAFVMEDVHSKSHSNSHSNSDIQLAFDSKIFEVSDHSELEEEPSVS